MSSLEQKKLKEKLENVFTGLQIVEDYRPSELCNPKTNLNYEIDLYLPYFGAGFEYQGAVHFNNLKKFNNDSDKSRYNDMAKQYLSEHSEISLAIVEIFPTDLDELDSKKMILNRIQNSIDDLVRKTLYSRAKLLEYMKEFIILGLDSTFQKTKDGFVVTSSNKVESASSKISCYGILTLLKKYYYTSCNKNNWLSNLEKYANTINAHNEYKIFVDKKLSESDEFLNILGKQNIRKNINAMMRERRKLKEKIKYYDVKNEFADFSNALKVVMDDLEYLLEIIEDSKVKDNKQ